MILQSSGEVFGWFISVILNIIVAVILANRAKEKGVDSTPYVLVTCLCGCCIGIFVFMLFSDNQTPEHRPSPPRRTSTPKPTEIKIETTLNEKICANCGAHEEEKCRFCPQCGHEFGN